MQPSHVKGEKLIALAHIHAKRPRNRKDVFVPATTHVHADNVILGQVRRNFHHMGQCVRRFQRWNDAFLLATQLKRLQRFDICNGHVLRTTNIMQPRMFGTCLLYTSDAADE